MNNRNRFFRGAMAFLLLRTPMRTYGELVLRPVTMAERANRKGLHSRAGHNKT
jgi:hypothetical protein